MDLKYLKYFVAVAESGSINKAANAMYISQPHLSFIIREIEEEAGTELMIRTSRGVRLTPAGEEWLRHCRNILSEASAMLHTGDADEKSEKIQLHISATRFTETSLCFAEFVRKYEKSPKFQFDFRECSTTDVILQTAEGIADIGVIHFSTLDSEIMTAAFTEKNLYFEPVAYLYPCIAVSAHHPLIKSGTPVTPDSILGCSLIRYISDYEDFFYRIHTAEKQYDFTSWPRIIRVSDREAQLKLLETTDGFTIGIQNFENQARRYRVISFPITDAKEKIVFGILRQSSRKKILTTAENTFLDSVRNHYHRLQLKEMRKK